MKKSNEKFISNFLNQLDSGKLVQVIQGLLNSEDEIATEIVNKEQKVENLQPPVVIEKLTIQEKDPKFPAFVSDDDEKVEKWFAEASKRYLEPKSAPEVKIEEDVYGALFTSEGKKDALTIKTVLEKQELFNKLLRDKKKDALNAVNKMSLPHKDYVKSKSDFRDFASLPGDSEYTAYKAAEERVDQNLPSRNSAEAFLMARVRNDRIAKKINSKQDNGQEVFEELQSHIQEIQQKNKELDELNKQIDANAQVESQLDELEEAKTPVINTETSNELFERIENGLKRVKGPMIC